MDNNVIVVIITGQSKAPLPEFHFVPLSNLTFVSVSLAHSPFLSPCCTHTWPSSCCCGAVGVSPPLPLVCDLAVTLLALSQEGCDMAPV